MSGIIGPSLDSEDGKKSIHVVLKIRECCVKTKVSKWSGLPGYKRRSWQDAILQLDSGKRESDKGDIHILSSPHRSI